MRKLIFALMIFFIGLASAQGTSTVSVKVSNQTQWINNKEYYIHIVEQGQTVFSIARAYGLRYYDAVIKTDIHLLKVGDTVWLPKNEYSVASVSAQAEETISASSGHYIKVEPGQTLYGLSREYGVTIDDIIEANPELRTEQLKAGQMLKIPARKDLASNDPSTPQQSNPKPTNPQPTNPQQSNPKPTNPQPTNPQLSKPQSSQSADSQLSTLPTHQPSKDTTIYAGRPPVPFRPVVNPYPFAEVPSDFPVKQAQYYSFFTPSNFNYQVRDLQSRDRIYVTVVMPLNLSKINEISTSKFDIEQRGKKEYKVFEFIQFYEGILIALEQLQNQGVNVVLNVVDLTSDKDEDIAAAFHSHNVANSDFIIALLVKEPFRKLAELAKENQVFVINPFSSRVEVVKDNPYVIKCMPSVEGTVRGMLDIVAKKHPKGHLYIIHSNTKSNNSDEYEYRLELQKQLEQRKDIQYTFFDWAANAKLVSTLKSTNDNVIISIYNQDKKKNMVYATTILNRLSSLSTHVPTMMTVTNFLTEYNDVDFAQLQHLNYTTVTTGYLDYANNPKHKAFIDTYKDKFRTEPNTLYAGVAHDIMLYFTLALHRHGAEFWRNPQKFTAPDGMLFPFSLKQYSSEGGYENQTPVIYQMQNYKLIKQ